jgi:hypothetical protein
MSRKVELSDFNIKEEIQTLRVWILILNGALGEAPVNRELAQQCLKEIVNIFAEISYIYDLWSGGDGNRNVK